MTNKLRRSLKISFAAFSLIFATNLSAQETEPSPFQNPPVNVEVMPGTRGISFQTIIDKKIKSVPKLGFFSVTDFNSDWNQEQLSDLMVLGKVTVDVFKNVRVGAGFQSTPGGIRPSAAIIYTYANPEWLVIAMPRVDLSKNATFETLGIVEYKTEINENWRFYSRLQGTYVHAVSAHLHARSYLRARAGVTHKEFTFGLGANMEYYGPLKHNENNFGAFLQVALF
ncbi:hypothetical protein OA84_05725 [Kaistella solincola]|uniref:Uncharacterized protein n=1 Tax=Kaistella solincola TaxID=510955 RepID=A0ABR4ZNZ4_9FLAO|nr:hypothetical protein [Kaistella solincola]KIA83055.1 hypothetical protein OA84_05725 [Kaistella solincola]